MDLLRARLVLRYILGEMVPTFFLGVIVFIFILLMFQALRLTSFVLVHGLKLTVVLEIMAYISASFLPVLFPMSLLFTVLLTYGRLSSDSEIIAFKASGLSMVHIVAPALVLSVLVAILSAQTAFHIAPWGNRQFEVLFTQQAAQKPGVSLKEGTFSEGFFDLVVYANKVDSKRGVLEQVFIYDESDQKTPITVIAREGQLMVNPDRPGNEAFLKLTDGDIHRTSQGRHTKIAFGTYEIRLTDPVSDGFKAKSLPSLSLDELKAGIKDEKLPAPERLKLNIEFQKRLAISVACLFFGLIGVGLGTTTNRRAAKSGGLVICIGLIVSYWVMYLTGESLAKQGTLTPIVAMWFPNAVFCAAAFFTLRRASK